MKNMGYLFSCMVVLASISGFGQTSPGSQCEENMTSARADDSPNKRAFEQILRLGASSKLEDFLIFWYPERSTFSVSDERFIHCVVWRDDPKCISDTFYSWGPAAKVESLKKTMNDGGDWHGNPNPGHNLDTLSSAVGSFGYGSIPVRLKLKSNNFGFGEIVVDDANEVESWSYGTPEHYDEIVRDILRAKSGKPWHGYSALGGQLFDIGTLDRHEFTEEKLKDSLLIMIRTILAGEGRIFYSKGSCRNRHLTFLTRFPTYINPNPNSYFENSENQP